jgi:hypothetical protein
VELSKQGMRGGTVVCCGGLLRGDVESIGASIKICDGSLEAE